MLQHVSACFHGIFNGIFRLTFFGIFSVIFPPRMATSKMCWQKPKGILKPEHLGSPCIVFCEICGQWIQGQGARINLVVNNEENHCESSLPSGKRLHNYGKSPFFMGKSTISMVIFHSYVKLPEGKIIRNKKSLFTSTIVTNHWLVLWNMALIFPNSWDDDPIWLSYFSEGWLNHQPDQITISDKWKITIFNR